MNVGDIEGPPSNGARPRKRWIDRIKCDMKIGDEN